MKSLAAAVQDLPRELVNIIYDSTFISDGGDREITRKYQPPSRLQVSQGTRQKFAKSYYSNTDFYIDRTLFNKWLSMLEPAYAGLVRVVYVTGFNGDSGEVTSGNCYQVALVLIAMYNTLPVGIRLVFPIEKLLGEVKFKKGEQRLWAGYYDLRAPKPALFAKVTAAVSPAIAI